ncbi:MAG: hypothetical protein QNL78_02085 [Actinomycetes bacterium]
MRTIFLQLKASLFQLFPSTKFRLILVVLVLTAAFISVSELAVAKFFMQIILHEDELTRNQMILFVGAFFLFLGGTRAGHYFQRIYRINVFDRAFGASEKKIHRRKENWRWLQAFELTGLLTTVMQLSVIILFSTFLNWKFGLLNIVVVASVIQILGRIFGRQLKSQRGFVKAKKRKEHVSSLIKIGTRIRSGETGILLSGLAMLILFGALIALSFTGEISTSNTVVLFFGLRMQNSGLSNISRSLMKFARARTHSE